jgi:hypothetical protein
VGSEVESAFETRRRDKEYLMQILLAQHDSKEPRDFNRLLVWVKAQMEPKDVKLVLYEFEEWKKSQ